MAQRTPKPMRKPFRRHLTRLQFMVQSRVLAEGVRSENSFRNMENMDVLAERWEKSQNSPERREHGLNSHVTGNLHPQPRLGCF